MDKALRPRDLREGEREGPRWGTRFQACTSTLAHRVRLPSPVTCDSVTRDPPRSKSSSIPLPTPPAPTALGRVSRTSLRPLRHCSHPLPSSDPGQISPAPALTEAESCTLNPSRSAGYRTVLSHCDLSPT
eukprot:1829161-Rhodomonas_salina.1